jgi:hypothetical protein
MRNGESDMTQQHDKSMIREPTQVTEASGQPCDIHLLTDAELDEVNGGAAFLFFVGVTAGIWLSAGIIAVAREYQDRGSGNVDFNERVASMPMII